MQETTLLFHELYLQYIDSISDEFMDEDEIDRLYDEYVRKCSIVNITARPILPFSSKNLNYASMMLVPIPKVKIPVDKIKRVYLKVTCQICGAKVLDTNITRHKKTKKCKTKVRPNQALC
jgi:hypothetical protein